jgi:integrase
MRLEKPHCHKRHAPRSPPLCSPSQPQVEARTLGTVVPEDGRAGAKPGNAHQVHRTARTALGEAHRRGYVSRNVAALAKAPRVDVEEVEPYSVAEVRAILAAAELLPNRARWAVALALGLRQGEVLGLRWSDVTSLEGTAQSSGRTGRPAARCSAHRSDGAPGARRP